MLYDRDPMIDRRYDWIAGRVKQDSIRRAYEEAYRKQDEFRHKVDSTEDNNNNENEGD